MAQHAPQHLLVLAVLLPFSFALLDRRAIVSRHSLIFTAPTGADLDRFDALTIGNGAFAMNVDPTGLQTLPQVVSAFSLNTLSDWQFHSLPAVAGPPYCALVDENDAAVLSCGPNLTIGSIVFASYGNPGGACGAFSHDSTCDDSNSTAVAAAACIGKASCSVPATNAAFGGDPCLGRHKRLAIQVGCSGPPPPPTPPSRAAYLDRFKYTYFDTPVSANRTVPRPFATDNNISGSVQGWPMSNPHRVGLGELSLRLAPAGATPATAVDPGMIPPSSFTNISAFFDVWAGGMSSAYTLEDAAGGGTWAITIATSVHPDLDLLATRLTCAPGSGSGGGGCPASLRLAFPYANGQWGPAANDWASDSSLHSSIVVLNDTAQGTLRIQRVMDDALFDVTCQWDDARWLAARTGPHTFSLLPPPGLSTASVAFSCLWTPANLVYPIGMVSSAFVQRRVAAAASLLAGPARFPLQPAVQAAAAAMWAAFWEGGAFLDIAGATNDPRAAELERRVVLSRFLTRSNSAGACPPQETGLLSNSWSGKFHLEM